MADDNLPKLLMKTFSVFGVCVATIAALEMHADSEGCYCWIERLVPGKLADELREWAKLNFFYERDGSCVDP